MTPEIANIIKNYLDVSKIALSWKEEKITAQVAMEQIVYILIDVDLPNRGV